MKDKRSRKNQAKILRIFRKVHRTTGAFLFIFFFFISVSGVILGWKKDSFGLLLPETHQGSSQDLKQWLPIAHLHEKAIEVLRDSISPKHSTELNRIDIRKKKGTVKFIFEDHFYGIQLDGATGNVLNIGKRHSDLVENIHDGSILDEYFGTQGYIKLLYTTIMGFALLIFTITGFWLWYGPKRMRAASRSKEKI